MDNWDISHLVIKLNYLAKNFHFIYIYQNLLLKSREHLLLYYLFSGATPRYANFGGRSPKPFVLADLACSGREINILSCSRRAFGVTHCSIYEHAAVKCLGML